MCVPTNWRHITFACCSTCVICFCMRQGNGSALYIWCALPPSTQPLYIPACVLSGHNWYSALSLSWCLIMETRALKPYFIACNPMLTCKIVPGRNSCHCLFVAKLDWHRSAVFDLHIKCRHSVKGSSNAEWYFPTFWSLQSSLCWMFLNQNIIVWDLWYELPGPCRWRRMTVESLWSAAQGWLFIWRRMHMSWPMRRSWQSWLSSTASSFSSPSGRTNICTFSNPFWWKQTPCCSGTSLWSCLISIFDVKSDTTTVGPCSIR